MMPTEIIKNRGPIISGRFHFRIRVLGAGRSKCCRGYQPPEKSMFNSARSKSRRRGLCLLNCTSVRHITPRFQFLNLRLCPIAEVYGAVAFGRGMIQPPPYSQRHHYGQPEQVADGEAETHGT